MSTLTDYRRPVPRYATADAGWRPAYAWEIVGGVWQRLWRRRSPLCSQARGLRKAQVWRAAGAWTWRVVERDARGVWRETARAARGSLYYTAQAAWPFAELAAGTR